MARKRPNPADFRFEKRSEETLLREPGQISPYDFSIDTLDKCVVYLMDKIAQVTVDRVTNSRLHFGPTDGSIFLRDCENCVVTASCAQFRLKNCKRLYIFLYCGSDPAIEYSSELIFGPYNFSYPLQNTHFAQAKLDVKNDKWSQVFDFNKNDEEHWRLMRPEEFKVMEWEKDELGSPENPVPRHEIYGGDLRDDIKVGSQQHGEQGLMSFTFDTSQHEAQRVVEKEEPKRDDNVFEKNESYTGITSQNVGLSNPFGNNDPFGVSSDPFGTSDPFTSNDPFNNNEPFEGQGESFAPQPSDPFVQAEVNTEELERQRLRDQENRDRNKKMMNKDEKERMKKDEKRQQAREDLKKWHSDRNKQILKKKELNQEAERLLLEKRKTFPTSWKKVSSMIEGEDRKDVARMKSVLLAKKHEN
jgi:hypothetical protein